ncbi:MAG: NRDE family protein [Luteolibacter sp.]
MSWWRTEDRYGVLFNRDEQKKRPCADPPSIQENEFLAPRDPAGGGTWLSVNKNGVIIALLNRWQDLSSTPRNLRSRGLLVRDLATTPDVSSLEKQLETLDLSRYAPFTLLAIDSRCELRWDWKDDTFTSSVPASPVSSSSFKTAEVLQTRDQIYNQLVGTRPSQATLEKFHQEASQGAYSPRMCRPDAQTWSRSHIVVTGSQIHWKYLEEYIDFEVSPTTWLSTLSRNQLPFSE